jgi:RNA polymerase sigma-70 factor (ECF subfamily)
VLITRVKNGEKAAFEQFFRHFYPMAVAYANRLLLDKDLARDAAQDVFIRLWKMHSELDPSKSITAFVLKSVRNHCLNVIRSQKRIASISEEEPAEIMETESSATKEAQSQLLSGLIKNLPERQREALELSRFKGLSHDQIAEIMQISARTVNNHIVQALKSLRASRNLFMEL